MSYGKRKEREAENVKNSLYVKNKEVVERREEEEEEHTKERLKELHSIEVEWITSEGKTSS